jgi:hypothetical protein
MEGLLNGRGDFADNVRMLRHIGAKYIGRSICLWGGEAKLLDNFERARRQRPQVHAADRDMILEACIFEIVTTQVEQVPVPDWAFIALDCRRKKETSVTTRCCIRRLSAPARGAATAACLT